MGKTTLRRFLVASVIALIALPAAAQAPGAGRFVVTPDNQGFIRLDTRTGATTHCAQEAGVWSCHPVIEDVGALSEALSQVDDRVAALTARLDQAVGGTNDEAPDHNPGFVATAVERLLELVRTLKHGRAGEA